MLSIIVAKDISNAIGKDNKLLFRIREDLKRFKEITTGHTIIMGRKTFESLPNILPDRFHIVITKNKDNYEYDLNVMIANNIENILELKDDEEEYFIIGGGEIYKYFLPHADKIYLTSVNTIVEDADTFFPYIDYNDWKVVEIEEHKKNDRQGYSYDFINLVRR